MYVRTYGESDGGAAGFYCADGAPRPLLVERAGMYVCLYVCMASVRLAGTFATLGANAGCTSTSWRPRAMHACRAARGAQMGELRTAWVQGSKQRGWTQTPRSIDVAEVARRRHSFVRAARQAAEAAAAEEEAAGRRREEGRRPADGGGGGATC
jgi:hypothetical protein